MSTPETTHKRKLRRLRGDVSHLPLETVLYQTTCRVLHHPGEEEIETGENLGETTTTDETTEETVPALVLVLVHLIVPLAILIRTILPRGRIVGLDQK